MLAFSALPAARPTCSCASCPSTSGLKARSRPRPQGIVVFWRMDMARGTRAKAGGALPGAKALPVPVAPAHRGRIQVQGVDMSPERSYAWAQGAPPTAAASLVELERLRAQ